MNIGVTAALTDRDMAPGAFAVAAEERGYHSLYLPEHTHFPVGSMPPALVDGVHIDDYRRTLDPFTALAGAAAVTDRILLGTGISLVAQHDPIVLAKQIATVDHLSGGRFVLGMGYGWNRQEATDHGVAFSDRRAIAREKVLCMQALWEHDEASFEGRWVTLPRPSRGRNRCSGLGCGPSSGVRPGRGSSPPSPNTPTDGCPSAGPGWERRWPSSAGSSRRPAVIRQPCTSSPSGRSRPRASSSTTGHSGSPRSFSGSPRATATRCAESSTTTQPFV